MSEECYVVAFVSGKGGTGKTTLTANFAVELASARQRNSPEGKDWKNRVLVIDNDYATGGASYLLAGGERLKSGMESKLIRPNTCFYDCYNEKIPADEVTPLRLMFEDNTVGEFEVHVLLNSLAWWKTPLPSSVDENEPHIELDEKGEGFIDHELLPYYEKLVTNFRERYDYILIDSRGGADTRASVAAVVADAIVIVTEPGDVAGKQDMSFVQSLRVLSEKIGRVVGTVSFVYNRVLDNERERAERKRDGMNVIGRLPISDQVLECYRNTELIFEARPLDPWCIEAIKAFRLRFPNEEGICHARRRWAIALLRANNICRAGQDWSKRSLVALALLTALGTWWGVQGVPNYAGALGWLSMLVPLGAIAAGATLGFAGMRRVFETFGRPERWKSISWGVGGVTVFILSVMIAVSAGSGLQAAKRQAATRGGNVEAFIDARP